MMQCQYSMVATDLTINSCNYSESPELECFTFLAELNNYQIHLHFRIQYVQLAEVGI